MVPVGFVIDVSDFETIVAETRIIIFHFVFISNLKDHDLFFLELMTPIPHGINNVNIA
jgi:hypothetical protein